MSRINSGSTALHREAACQRQVRDPMALDPMSDEGRRYLMHAAECMYCGARLLDGRLAHAVLRPLAEETLSPARVARLQESLYEALDGKQRPSRLGTARAMRVLARLMPLVAFGVAG